jgi:uncharacterized SAM-binding protein YcdF (DUF218 family)
MRWTSILEPSLCPRSSSQWTWLTHKVAGTLTKPIPGFVKPFLVMLVIGFVVILVQRLRKLHRQGKWSAAQWQRLKWGVLIGCSISIVLFSPLGLAAATQGLTAFLPKDSGEPADVIVVLGRGSKVRQSRVAIAAELWRAQRAPKIFVSGNRDAQAAVQLLLAEGLPSEAVGGEECSLTTEENARFTAQLLNLQAGQRMILVTDPPHLLRSWLTFKRWGFNAIPYASPFPDSLGHRDRFMFVLREYSGLTTYFLRGRFQAKEVTDSDPQ